MKQPILMTNHEFKVEQKPPFPEVKAEWAHGIVGSHDTIRYIAHVSMLYDISNWMDEKNGK
jgi:hypothetical protein